MDRNKHLTKAEDAVSRAQGLAEEAATYATRYAADPQLRQKVTPLAEAGALWADIARAHAAIAQAMTETEA
ncbi:hypothetical protein [Streptomyces sp. PAM3C]|uniref:hypothetical protein n=1 Tax=Streptomyces sp. PAM3C TaxID=2847300 RepID=UPI001C1E2281|nr:hypothetical protein [Streptomyces sp. PAM3C]MBU5944904.1 hypothetical protein [Streptomyces sp. PAM3C]